MSDNKESTAATAIAATAAPATSLRDLIFSMKARGVQRPDDITVEAWDAVTVTLGMTKDVLAASYRQKLLDAAMAKVPDKLPDDDKGKVTALFDLSVVSLIEVMTDVKTKDSVKAQVAMYVADHTIGKAKQEIEHSGSLALEIRAQAKAAIAAEQLSMRDVTEKQKVDMPQDPLDAFIYEHSQDDFVVGKKAAIDGE